MNDKPELNKLFFDLPIFDETDLGNPSLEGIAKELNILHDIEATQEDIASKIISFIECK